jgi:aminoglycoside phosphotransferase family enzyme/predicted kinase
MGVGMVEASEQRPELVSAMLEPGFYPDRPGSLELRETHISWVFLAGERAYKVKKPLVLPFLDYGSLERRREMCREEVRLNRRLAPEIYLRVVSIVRDGDRYRLAEEDASEASEYAVEMRRVDEERSLAALAGREELKPAQLAAVAERLARFHAEAAVAPPGSGGFDDLVATLDENLQTLRETAAPVLGGRRLDSAERFTRGFLASRRPSIERRAREGLVRDCHGDLRAEHVIVPSPGEVYVYDCVEFDPALRRIDVANDIAFLVMDLAALGSEEAGFSLIDAYRRAGGDPGDDALLSFFASYRAWVRAKVAALRARELSDRDPERPEQEERARSLFRLGHRLAWRARRPLALVVCGVAASGKSTLAREVADLSGWEHLSSDLARKRIAGLAPTERARQEHYSREFTERTYRELGETAGAALARGEGVIVDATFHRRHERGAFLGGLGDRSAPLLFVECRASEEVLVERARGREGEGDRVSDADAEVVRRQLAELEPLEEIGDGSRAELVTEAPSAELLGELERLVDGRLWQPPTA